MKKGNGRSVIKIFGDVDKPTFFKLGLHFTFYDVV